MRSCHINFLVYGKYQDIVQFRVTVDKYELTLLDFHQYGYQDIFNHTMIFQSKQFLVSIVIFAQYSGIVVNKDTT